MGSLASLQQRYNLGGCDTELLIEMLQRMGLIRAFDSRLPSLYTEGLVRGSSHASIGQEAVAIGACFALKDTDYVTSTHRGHGHTIAKGGDVGRMMAELLGRTTGYCRGKGGSMHIADFSIGMLGANGIVAGGIGIATGAALSASLKGSGKVALCFFGDGAINQGVFLECGNMAAIWKLPLILLCENNQFAMSSRPSETTSVSELTDRASAFGIRAKKVDGMDVLAVFEAVAEAASYARSGKGPYFIEAVCYRYEGHFSGDNLKYRLKDERTAWDEKDPILKLRTQLIDANLLTDEQADNLIREADHQIDAALEFAKASPLPDPRAAWEDLYA
jgi:acetoin:2,6-dichlorophenolindophenol oxidoreductase subunit alpha